MSTPKKTETTDKEPTAVNDIKVHALVIAFVSLTGLGFFASNYFHTSDRAKELEQEKIKLEQKFEGYRDGARDVAR